MQLLGGFCHIQSVVGNSFKITYTVQKLGNLPAVVIIQAFSIQLNQICTDNILVTVNLIFAFFHRFQFFGVKILQKLNGVKHPIFGKSRHFVGYFSRLLDSNGRRIQQTNVQNGFAFRMVAILNNKASQFFQTFGKGQHNRNRNDVENSMNNGDTCRIYGIVDKREVQHPMTDIEQNQENHRADNIKAQMHNGSPAGIFGSADGRKHCRNAGTDILSQNNGDGVGICNGACGRKRLQNTDRSRRTLDNRRQQSTCQHTQKGVAEKS